MENGFWSCDSWTLLYLSLTQIWALQLSPNNKNLFLLFGSPPGGVHGLLSAHSWALPPPLPPRLQASVGGCRLEPTTDLSR